MGERKEHLTDWTGKMREVDLAWIQENQTILASFASTEYEEWGRGLVFVNTGRKEGGIEQTYGYLTLSEVEEFEPEPVLNKVREYDPYAEMVISLVKFLGEGSVYRVPFSNPSEADKK